LPASSLWSSECSTAERGGDATSTSARVRLTRTGARNTLAARVALEFLGLGAIHMAGGLATLLTLGLMVGVPVAVWRAVKSKPKMSNVAGAELATLYSDTLAGELPSIRPASAILKSGETAYVEASSMLMESKSAGVVGGSRGVSVHVAKGLTLRAGAFRGHRVNHIVVAARGHLLITSQRVIFAGDRKSFAVPLDKLINITRYSNGFTFNDGSKSHNMMVPNVRERTIFTAILDRVLQPAA